MVKGLYTAYTGMVNQQHRLDVVSNNLANSKTTGFKKEGCTTQSFDEVLGIKIKDATVGSLNQNIGTLNLGAKIGETYRDWNQGSLVSTGNLFDLALEGKGFFNIEFTNKSGETTTMYTRDGSFAMNSEGLLVTKDGDFVMGESGPIQLPINTKDLTVESTGNIFADGKYIDKLKITDFEDYNYLEMYGENLFKTVEGAVQKDSQASVTQSFLEASNINVVSEMIDMITISRQYESGQKVMQTIDQMLEKMVNISQL